MAYDIKHFFLALAKHSASCGFLGTENQDPSRRSRRGGGRPKRHHFNGEVYKGAFEIDSGTFSWKPQESHPAQRRLFHRRGLFFCISTQSKSILALAQGGRNSSRHVRPLAKQRLYLTVSEVQHAPCASLGPGGGLKTHIQRNSSGGKLVRCATCVKQKSCRSEK